MKGKPTVDPRCVEMLARLTPTEAVHAGYLKQVREFIDAFGGVDKFFSPVTRLHLWKSQLFGRPYLVGTLARGFAQMDAGAVRSIPIQGFESPPMVLTPGRGDHTVRAYRSIIEHEIVHVNQALGGTFPDIPDVFVRDPFAGLMECTVAEFEANYLQLARWPDLVLEEFAGTLEEWCSLRGFTGGLEKVVLSVFMGQVGVDSFQVFLHRVSQELGVGFEKAGLNPEIGRSYQESIAGYTSVAVKMVIDLGCAVPPEVKPVLREFLEKQEQT